MLFNFLSESMIIPSPLVSTIVASAKLSSKILRLQESIPGLDVP
nr:MAG TPA: hypothetical protein [Bacteriophage sp.]